MTDENTTTLLKPKAKLKPKLKEGDNLNDTFVTIENMNEDEVLHWLPEYMKQISAHYLKIGGMLAAAQANKWFGGYETLQDFLVQGLGIHYRKGMHLIKCYNTLMECKVDSEDAEELGWTKLRILSRIMTTENAGYWVAIGKKMKTVDLDLEVSKCQAEAKAKPDTDPISSNIVSLNFKVHTDQRESIVMALADIREKMKTPYDSVALYNLSLAYLGGQVAVEPVGMPAEPGADDLKGLMAKFSYLDVLTLFGQLWPDITLNVETSS